MISKTRTALMLTAASAAALTGTTRALAAATHYAIPTEPLARALKDFARSADIQVVVASDLVDGKTSAGAVGDFTPEQAITAILAGSGLHAERVENAWVVRRDTEPRDNDAPQADSEIVVTGTRIRGAVPIGSSLTVIDRQAIETSGRATIADYIQTLPQNYNGGDNEASYGNNPHTSDNVFRGSSIDLRGLGTESTLVLFDGARPALGGTIGAFVDTSLIPTSAIDRIEILADGASAIYGTDAVAGVVNVRFRDHYDGFETHLYNGAAGGALHQLQASQAYGKRWSNGGLFLAYQYDRRSRLSGDDRAVSTDDLRPFGGPDNRDPYSVPGTILAADGEIFGIPANQDGRHLTAAELIPGQTNLTDEQRSVDLLPRQTTQSVYASFEQDLFAGISAYGHALYAHRAFDTASQPISLNPYTVPTTNPFYVDPTGTEQPITVDYNFAPELGRFRIHGHLNAVTTSGGLKGSWGGWNVDLNGSYGKQSTNDSEINGVSSTRVAISLADTDPATALNLFGDGTANNPATLAFIRSTDKDYARSTVWSTALRVDGTLFDLPAGPIKLAAGVEHRHEYFNSGYYYDDEEASPHDYDQYVTPGEPGRRHIDAIYAELSIPVLDAPNGAFPGKLDASLAGRTDWYSDVGRTINPKVGLSWAVVPGVMLRGTWGTSFRAPTFFENAGASGNRDYPEYVPDSNSPTGQSAAILLSGYAPSIVPEKATSWTAGVDFKPLAVPGLTISATYFDIVYRNRIASPGEDVPNILSAPQIYGSLVQTPTAAEVAAIYAGPQLTNLFGIPADEIRYIINIETQNLSRTTVRGVDFSVAYSDTLFGGLGKADVTGTRLIAMDQSITASAPPIDILGTIYNPTRWRIRGHAGWSRGGLSVDASVNYTGGYLNTLVAPSEHVSSWTTLDGQIGYRFDDASPLQGARIALSATNLLNARPPYVDNSLYGQTLAYDPNQASAIGRLVSIDLTIQW